MSRLREYCGYTHGELVEARYQPEPNELAGDWRNAVFVCGDSEDDGLPFAVKWGNGEPEDIWDYNDWIRPGNIRPRMQAAPVVWQFRSAVTAPDNEWVTLDEHFIDGTEVHFPSYNSSSARVVFRRKPQAPERTDAEKISAALAAYKASEPFSQVIDILEGNA